MRVGVVEIVNIDALTAVSAAIYVGRLLSQPCKAGRQAPLAIPHESITDSDIEHINDTRTAIKR